MMFMQRPTGKLPAGIIVCSVIFAIGYAATNAKQATRREASAIVDTLTVAAVQYPIEGNRGVDEIVAKVEAIVSEALADGADCVVFPELITLDAWRIDRSDDQSEPAPDDAAQLKRIAVEVSPGYLKKVASLAAKYKIDILVGSTPRLDGDSMWNTAYFFCRDGREFSQDKLYPTQWELDVGMVPGTELKICDASWGDFAILICYDVEFPDVSALLAREAPSLIFVPSMTESSAGLQRVQWCSQARAVEQHAFVVCSGTVGNPSPDWEHFGQASVIAPRDVTFDAQPSLGKRNVPFVLIERLDLKVLRQSRQATSFNPASRLLERTGGSAIRISRGKPN